MEKIAKLKADFLIILIYMKKNKLIIVLALAFISVPLLALAAENQFSQSIYVGENEIIDGNFIKVGNIIEINGAVNGDVIVAGNTINISGPVAGDVIAAGNIIRIKGTVMGSLRLAGSYIEIDSEVKHNVWALANTLTLNSKAKVGWDVFSGAANVEIKGPVSGNLWIAGANLLIENEIGKNITAGIDQEGELILYPQAKINGDINYKAKNENQLVKKEGAQVLGKINKLSGGAPGIGGGGVFWLGYLFGKIISFFSLLIIGLILITLLPKFLADVNLEMIKKAGPSIGWGLVYLILTPIIAVLLAITIIGLPLAVILILIFLIALYLSKVLAAFTLGLFLANQMSADKKYKGQLLWPFVFGLLVIVILGSIPLLGWLFKIILMLWAFGALIAVKKEYLKQYR